MRHEVFTFIVLYQMTEELYMIIQECGVVTIQELRTTLFKLVRLMLTHLMIHLAVRFDLLHRSNDISSIPIYIYIYTYKHTNTIHLYLLLI